MELLLNLRFPPGAARDTMDVAVELDNEATVGSLRDTLTRFALRYRCLPDGTDADQVTLHRSGAPAALDLDETVVAARVLSGDTVRLGVDAQVCLPNDVAVEDAVARGGLALDIVAGPQAGMLVPLGVGHVTVGRSRRCEVVVRDPTLSRQHAAIDVGPGGDITLLPHPDAHNGTYVDGRPVVGHRMLEPGELVHAGGTVFAVRAAVPEATRRRDQLGQVPLNRVPYQRVVVREQELDALRSPPVNPKGKPISILTAISPLFMGIAMYLILDRWYMLIMTAMSPVLLVLRTIGNRRGGRKRYARERDEFFASVENRAAALETALEDEQRARRATAPDLAELARQARFHQPRLWERNRDAGDALTLRLGLGPADSQIATPVASGGDDELREKAQARLAFHTTVEDVPVTVDLGELGTLGLWGDPDHVTSSGRALVVQACCLHSPEDLVVAAAIGETNRQELDWLKWLPHSRSAASPLAGDHLAFGADESRQLLGKLLQVVGDRAGRGRAEARSGFWPKVLLVLDETAGHDPSQLAQLLDVAVGHGIHPVWLGTSDLHVPRQCQAIVPCPGRGRPATVSFTSPDLDDRSVQLDGASLRTARSIARSLAPLRDASAAGQTTAIPRVVPLLDVVGLDDPRPGDVIRRWRRDRGYSLTFPLGLSADGAMELDLVEQGPHTLIGGTSGAGKSELLQTMVLGLASRYPPERLNFLFVDYKGGASSSEFQDLPHTVGYVTNLSGQMALRALTSLQAELQRRMQLMEGRAKDLAEMLTVAPDDAPPSLVIVVDEFAALVKEIPDFVAGMVDIAQRGRSLGIHLVLATQRPTGVVNDNILANTNLRISLRMLDPADSRNIIGTSDAADIPVPLRGRAFARTGPNALVPFQCAWAGAPFVPPADDTVDKDAAADISVQPFAPGPGDVPLTLVAQMSDAVAAAAQGNTGAEDTRPEPGAVAVAGGGGGGGGGGADSEPLTQMEVLVGACARAATELGLTPPRRPWVEPLGEVVELDDLPPGASSSDDPSSDDAGSDDPGRTVRLGLCDDPANQAQYPAVVDLEASGGLLVFGAGGTGKTTLLRTLALDLARQGDPDGVQIQVLDFASRGLDVLAELPHCGDVVPGDDLERVTRLLTVLTTEMRRRRDLLGEARAESLAALRAARGGPVLPRIVVILDNYGDFANAFEKGSLAGWRQRLHQLVSGGRQVGIHCVITADRRQGVGSGLVAAISSRVVLRMTTPEEMGALGVPNKVAKAAELPTGRGFLDGSTEVQLACVSADHSSAGQAEAITAAAIELTQRCGGRAPTLPELPELAELAELAKLAEINGNTGNTGHRGKGRNKYQGLRTSLGVADLSLDVVDVDLARQNLLVTGPPLSGKSTALTTVARGLRQAVPGMRLVAVGSAASPLADLDLWDESAFARARQAEVLKQLVEEVEDDEGIETRVVLFLDAAEDLDDREIQKALETVVKKDCVRLAVSCEPNTVAKAYSGWLSTLRRNRSAVMLQPESPGAVESTIGVKPALRPGQGFPPGRGILAADRRWTLIQVAVR